MEFAKYLSASAFALMVDYSVYWLLVQFLDLSLPLAATLGYAAGLAVAYGIIVNRVFRNGWLSDRRHIEVVLFGLSGALGLGLTYAAVTLFTAVFGERMVAAKIVAVATSFFGVYIFRKKFVFRTNEPA